MKEQQAGNIDAGELERFIAGVHFPANKSDLVSHAEGKGAPKKILELMNSLPTRQYESVTDFVVGIRDTRH